MLTGNANGLFNNEVIKGWKIRAMRKDDKQIHAQMQRLYEAARVLKNAATKADVARIVNQSQQTLNAWENRGMSSNGLIEAAIAVGVNHLWLRDGAGEMQNGTAPASGTLDDVVQLISCYGRLEVKDREMVLRFARSLLLKEQNAR